MIGCALLLILLAGFIYIVSKPSPQKIDKETIANSLATTTINEKSDIDSKAAYSVGYLAAKGIKEQYDTLKYQDLIQGVKDAYNNQSTLTEPQMQEAIKAYEDSSKARWVEQAKIMAQDNLTKSQEFLAGVKAQPDIKSTEMGVLYKVIKEGTGASPKPDDTVTVIYEGKDAQGNVLDSSNNQPLQFVLSDLIKGWSDGISSMKEGGHSIIYIPPNLAYGETGSPEVEPNSVLVFDIQLVKVGKNKALPVTRAIPEETGESQGAVPEDVKSQTNTKTTQTTATPASAAK